MASLVEGPSWGVAGTSGAIVLNPLRVENSIFSVVDRLLPGVISTTPARATWDSMASSAGRQYARAERRAGYRPNPAMRGSSRRHRPLSTTPTSSALPEAHGESSVRGMLEADGSLDVAKVSAPGKYSKAVTGFYGTYRGPEIVLGIVDPGADQEPGDRYDDAVVRPALGEIFQLAEHDRISAADLKRPGTCARAQLRETRPSGSGASSAGLRGVTAMP